MHDHWGTTPEPLFFCKRPSCCCWLSMLNKNKYEKSNCVYFHCEPITENIDWWSILYKVACNTRKNSSCHLRVELLTVCRAGSCSSRHSPVWARGRDCRQGWAPAGHSWCWSATMGMTLTVGCHSNLCNNYIRLITPYQPYNLCYMASMNPKTVAPKAKPAPWKNYSESTGNSSYLVLTIWGDSKGWTFLVPFHWIHCCEDLCMHHRVELSDFTVSIIDPDGALVLHLDRRTNLLTSYWANTTESPSEWDQWGLGFLWVVCPSNGVSSKLMTLEILVAIAYWAVETVTQTLSPSKLENLHEWLTR